MLRLLLGVLLLFSLAAANRLSAAVPPLLLVGLRQQDSAISWQIVNVSTDGSTSVDAFSGSLRSQLVNYIREFAVAHNDVSAFYAFTPERSLPPITDTSLYEYNVKEGKTILHTIEYPANTTVYTGGIFALFTDPSLKDLVYSVTRLTTHLALDVINTTTWSRVGLYELSAPEIGGQPFYPQSPYSYAFDPASRSFVLLASESYEGDNPSLLRIPLPNGSPGAPIQCELIPLNRSTTSFIHVDPVLGLFGVERQGSYYGAFSLFTIDLKSGRTLDFMELPRGGNAKVLFSAYEQKSRTLFMGDEYSGAWYAHLGTKEGTVVPFCCAGGDSGEIETWGGMLMPDPR